MTNGGFLILIEVFPVHGEAFEPFRTFFEQSVSVGKGFKTVLRLDARMPIGLSVEH